jgi:hypothetical protein
LNFLSNAKNVNAVQLVRELENIGGEMDRMKRRRSELDAEIQRLTAGRASGVHSLAVMGEITKREHEVSDISDRLLSSRPDSIRLRVKALRDGAMQQIIDLRSYLNTDPIRARAFLTKQIEKITMEPTGRAYIASGRWSLLGEGRWECAEGQS